MQTLSFIGGGRITNIILQAFQNAEINFEKVVVFDVNEDSLKSLQRKFPHTQMALSLEETVNADLIVLAVHPPVAVDVLEKLKGTLVNESLLLSLVPKITIERTIDLLGGFADVARMNPSASTIVNKGVNPVAFSASFDSNKKKDLLDLFQPLGYMPEISDSKIEAYAVISAMGHTYFNFQLQQLRELALSFGMEEDEAAKAITHMLWGTTETLFNSGLTYSEVADLVPVKPLGEVEEIIKGYYRENLNAIYNKIKPQ
ncbi:MAG: NAD(P)-binding domain-containing protein [Bacteroidales bacterium]|nr:NAD(P)-binding domain-containing protein [Bacteroidales bacterium]